MYLEVCLASDETPVRDGRSTAVLESHSLRCIVWILDDPVSGGIEVTVDVLRPVERVSPYLMGLSKSVSRLVSFIMTSHYRLVYGSISRAVSFFIFSVGSNVYWHKCKKSALRYLSKALRIERLNQSSDSQLPDSHRVSVHLDVVDVIHGIVLIVEGAHAELAVPSRSGRHTDGRLDDLLRLIV